MLGSITKCACGLSIIVLGSMLAPAGAASYEDPVGTWKLNCTPPDGKPRHCLVAVTREGQTLKGTYTSEGVTRPVEAIAFDGGELRVRVNGEFGGLAYSLTYRGRPAGDALAGSVRWSYGIAGGSFAFEGERIRQKAASSR
jgi:hypothetical protein